MSGKGPVSLPNASEINVARRPIVAAAEAIAAIAEERARAAAAYVAALRNRERDGSR